MTRRTRLARLRAERHANSHLPRALRDGVADDSVDPDDREQQRREREGADDVERESSHEH